MANIILTAKHSKLDKFEGQCQLYKKQRTTPMLLSDYSHHAFLSIKKETEEHTIHCHILHFTGQKRKRT